MVATISPSLTRKRLMRMPPGQSRKIEKRLSAAPFSVFSCDVGKFWLTFVFLSYLYCTNLDPSTHFTMDAAALAEIFWKDDLT